jgi:hypothetical protein
MLLAMPKFAPWPVFAGPPISVIGGVAGAIIGSLIGGVAGGSAGAALGEVIDNNILNNFHALLATSAPGKNINETLPSLADYYV